MNKLKLIHLFSGVGAPEMALKRLGIPLEIVGFSEIDKYAIQSYKAIHGDIPNLGDIEHIERLPKANLVVYGSPCLTGDTLVLTSLGYKQIVDVNIDDEVLGHDGAFHKVTDFLEQGIKPTYKIKAMGMDSIRCTDNHKFYVRKMYRKYPTINGKKRNERHFKEPEWVECKNLDKSYYMGMPINNKSELPNWSGVEYSRWKHEHNELPLDNPDFWYITGRFLGDGWVRDRKDRNCQYSSTVICCGKSEINELESKMTVFNYTKVEDRTVFRLQISNKEFATFLSNFGHGAGEKFVPGFVMNLPKDLLKSFIDGYLESDGCHTQNRYKGTSISKKLIYGLTQCIAKVYNRPFSIYHTKRKPTCIIEGREVNQKDSFEFAFHDKARKQDKAFYENGYIWYPIQSIESTGLEESVYDITVEDCHSFVANNCITHNCQDFSIAGKQRGLINEQGEQTRSGLLLEVERLIETAKANNELPEILLMENVKNLVSKKFKPDFDRWLQKLDEVGYNNYWQVLNAKDFGVPQNRERVFVLSLRKNIDKRGYNFPKEMQLLKRLKDVLETEVEDKYYLSDKAVEGFLKHNENHLAKGTGFLWKPRDLDGYASCLRANGALCPTDNTIQEYYRGNGVIEYNIAAQRGRYVEGDSGETEQKDNLVVESYDTPLRLGNIYGREKGTSFAGNVYDKNAISPTLNTMQGGNRQPMIVDDTIHKIDIPQTVRVRKYDVDNEKLVNLLRNHKTLTNKQIAESLDVPLTKVEHWFRTDIHFAIPDAEIWYQLKELLGITTNEFDEAIMTFEEREGVYEKSNRCYLDSDVAPTLTTLSGKEKVITDFRIRRLTPLECWRLMDFSDEDFNKAKASGLSNTQLYKIAGNSIVVNVLYHIFRKLFIDFNEVKSSE